VLVVILIATLVVVGLLFLVMSSMVNKMLIFPLNQITAASRRIAEGTQSENDHTEYIQELEDIRTALSNLVEQKVSLERDNISQAYEKEHALLQYYQLQTRSHFVLNCLKSIYNLSAKGEMEKTLQIITLFSNHMRYVFHDSLSLVTVRAELDEVNDYFRIIQSERSDAIVLNQNVDQELLDFKIPPLTIQTFLENFNKFNAPSSKILRFSIRIDKVEMDDRFYVRLRLSDNGVGYSEEALTKIQVPDKVFERYHIGTQNLCRRLDLLYKDKYQIAFFNNPGGGASSVIYLPLEDK
jgi:LytS/YehU family sensor histidine kinase